MGTSSELLFLLAVTWCLLWSSIAGGRWLLGVIALLGTVHWVLADRGLYLDATATPPPQVLILAPVLLALAAVVASPGGRRWLRSTDLVALTALHILRIPVELVLHDAYTRGLVPQSMTYSGHNFDLFSGISAAFMVAWMLSRRPPGRGVLIAWNVVCLVLLVIVVVTAALSIPSVIQRWDLDQPNVLVLRTPYILLPAVIVPAVLWAHVAALVRLTAPAKGVPAR